MVPDSDAFTNLPRALIDLHLPGLAVGLRRLRSPNLRDAANNEDDHRFWHMFALQRCSGIGAIDVSG